MIDFLLNRHIEMKVNDFVLLEILILVGIPQEFLISLILYLFYNADLLEEYNNIRLYTSATSFVNNVNILTYNKSIKQNC
jgi:hypothetical protein